MRGLLAVCIVAACGGNGSSTSDSGGGGDDSGGGGNTLSDMHPGDVGLGTDPAVIWFEDFEAANVAAIVERYDQAQGQARMQQVTDHAGGAHALALTAGGTVAAVDLYKQLPNHDDIYVRWYAKYQPNIPWHHSGMWFGGYNPGMPFPSPGAGTRPAGNDRFSISVEPVWDSPSATPRFDFYNYWMTMHSWMAPPINDNGTAYYGNALIHHNNFTVEGNTWICLEVHAKLNTSTTSSAGAMLEVWKNDTQVIHLDDTTMGYWIRDKFCTQPADGTECTDYPAPFDTKLDLQMRSTTALAFNAFWPQNYITDPAMGTLTFDQMVVATKRVGCIR